MINKNCLTCKKDFKIYPCRKDSAKYCSKKCHAIGSWGEKGYWLGKKRPEVKKWLVISKEQRIKNLGKYIGETSWNKGKKLSFAHRKALSESHKGQVPWNYKGGIKLLYDQIRNSFEYREWRTAVYERDNYTCQVCGTKHLPKSGKLQANHIKQFAFYPELRFNLDNGQTLCIPCHKNTDTYGRWQQT